MWESLKKNILGNYKCTPFLREISPTGVGIRLCPFHGVKRTLGKELDPERLKLQLFLFLFVELAITDFFLINENKHRVFSLCKAHGSSDDLHWRYWPSLNTTFFPPKICCGEQLLGVWFFFWWKTSIGCLVFVLRKQGLFFVSQWKFPTQKNGTPIFLTKIPVKGSEFIVSTNCFTAPSVLVKCMRIRNVQKPLLNVDRTNFCRQVKRQRFSFIHVNVEGVLFFLVVFVACKRFRFLLDHFVSIHWWVGWVMSTFPCHLQEIYLQPSIGLVLHRSIPGKTSRDLNWKMGRSFQHGIFLQFSWGMICHSQWFVTCSEPCFFWKAWLL